MYLRWTTFLRHTGKIVVLTCVNQDGYPQISVRSDIVSGHIELTNFSNLAHT